jgi:hypothetical protein
LSEFDRISSREDASFGVEDVNMWNSTVIGLEALSSF